MMNSGWYVPRIAAGMISLVMLISGGAAMQIDSCTTITGPGEYKLNRSLDDVSSCIGITSDDVILDGAGYVIGGQGSGDGVAVLGLSALRNITVKNMTTQKPTPTPRGKKANGKSREKANVIVLVRAGE